MRANKAGNHKHAPLEDRPTKRRTALTVSQRTQQSQKFEVIYIADVLHECEYPKRCRSGAYE